MEIPQIPDLILYAIPFFIVSMLIEWTITTHQNNDTYQLKDARTSIVMGLGNVATNLFLN